MEKYYFKNQRQSPCARQRLCGALRDSSKGDRKIEELSECYKKHCESHIRVEPYLCDLNNLLVEYIKRLMNVPIEMGKAPSAINV